MRRFYSLCWNGQIALRITHGGLVIERVPATQATTDQDAALNRSPEPHTSEWKLFDREGLLYMNERVDGEEGVNQYEPHFRLRDNI